MAIASLITSAHWGLITVIPKAMAQDILSVTCGGENISSLALQQDEKRTLTAAFLPDAVYQWQIRTDPDSELWVDIAGQSRHELTLGYAMLGSMVDERGVAYVRCTAHCEEKTVISAPIRVTVSNPALEECEMNPQITTAARSKAKTAAYTSCTVTVNYQYENGQIAFEPYAANIAAGEDFTATVSFPAIVGYLPYLGDDTQSTTQLTIQLENIQSDITYTVTYKPAMVDFQIRHYVQNILDDHYALYRTTSATGLTGSPVGENRDLLIDGFAPLYYDKDVRIAADGSTEIEIYYDRNYYLVYFDLDGGYGVDPVYTRYQAEVSANVPTRPGYIFRGWELSECGVRNESGGIVYRTASASEKAQYDLNGQSISLPAMNLKYRALWDTADTTYTVVYWTENADDSGYSYLASKEGLVARSASLVSGNDDYIWSEKDHFTFSEEKTDRDVTVAGDGSTVINVYYRRKTYTLTFPSCGASTLICDKTPHTHSDSCCKYGGTGTTHRRHTRNCCTQDLSSHTHGDDCYFRSDHIVTAKYGSDISHIWEETPIQELLTEGYVFQSSVTNKYYSFLEKMPEQDITMTKIQWSGSTYTWDYWLEYGNGIAAPEGAQTKTDGAKTYYRYHTTSVNGNQVSLTYEEDYFPITGFVQRDPVVPNFQDRKADLYYVRNMYHLSFINYGEKVTGKGGDYLYEASLEKCDFIPDYPEKLEPNAYEFAGWYTTPQCFTGSEFDVANAKMPAHDVALYAKWKPKTHTLRVFRTFEDIAKGTTLESPLGKQQILHGSFAQAPQGVSNGNYVFSGWFYMDGGQKKAFDFYNMAVNRDLDIFAEWSSRVAVLYTIRYELEDGTEIASPTIGSAMAGTSKTFQAKGGEELYAGFREGYFPKTNSHTVLVDVEGENDFTFVYVQKEAVPYTVRYLEQKTQRILLEEKYVPGNRKAVVTEVFAQIGGYLPDAYQKRLVLSANPEENVLTFWYTKDDCHAYYIVTHWIQNLEGDGYSEYRVIQGPGEIGSVIREESLDLTGFSYRGYTHNDGQMQAGVAAGEVAAGGLKLDLYYDRIQYAYEVKYLEYGTGRQLHPTKTTQAIYRYGKVVSEDAVSLPGYTLVGENQKTRTIRGAGDVIVFYYTENTVAICYIPVGAGHVSVDAENVKAATGTAQGSAPVPEAGYRFAGWFQDNGCTQPVKPEWIRQDHHLTPQQEDGLYVQATYYAKFVEDTASLTIQKQGAAAADENQAFLFCIKGTDNATKDIAITVTIHGNGQTTITDLPAGNYTVTELTDWSWRYTPEDGKAEKAVTLSSDGSVVVFKNKRTESNWLDGDHYMINLFGTAR